MSRAYASLETIRPPCGATVLSPAPAARAEPREQCAYIVEIFCAMRFERICTEVASSSREAKAGRAARWQRDRRARQKARLQARLRETPPGKQAAGRCRCGNASVKCHLAARQPSRHSSLHARVSQHAAAEGARTVSFAPEERSQWLREGDIRVPPHASHTPRAQRRTQRPSRGPPQEAALRCHTELPPPWRPTGCFTPIA